ncbi:hypothetical protein PC9H_000950 [Pleurotus ostreatus]|uniref:TLC domain-containing protein n=2 Tax=Pleurotus ostreatus TaxID=5322 RepID=A0A067NZT6_PLEO1|nr:uncharacterized protein PC9H_000950 [Pleurotus ostreatus]KAF7440604.1 hypothetical protein PC9H_000950 [Pleurotus ostreatus]KAJ8700021.1 hypothetical protein PTI98_003088 [Pleurotus ostreatus]KDQ33394.1 hypothetical protein PLEOSDRAFT_1091469 [Pleurotus ostreatus PC15]
MGDVLSEYAKGLHDACANASRPVADFLGASKLPEHADTIFLSFLLFLAVHQVLAPHFSKKWFPVAYGTANSRGKNNWSIHVVSQVHAVLIISWAWRCLWLEELDKDKVSGWHHRVGALNGIACGYFLWDTLDAIVNFVDLSFVIHGFACLLIYALGYRPFVAYYGVRCLFWETSTIFLNIHWFLDKTGRTGSTFQLINGIALLGTFFFVRLVWGGYISYNFLATLYATYRELPLTYTLVYFVGNVVLQCLNWLWFGKMVAALRKRFAGAPKSSANGKTHNGKAH